MKRYVGCFSLTTNLVPNRRIKSVTLSHPSNRRLQKGKKWGASVVVKVWLLLRSRHVSFCVRIDTTINELDMLVGPTRAQGGSLRSCPELLSSRLLAQIRNHQVPFRDHSYSRPSTTDAQLEWGRSTPNFRDEDPSVKTVSPASVTAERHDPRDSRIWLCCQIIPIFQTLQRSNINSGFG